MKNLFAVILAVAAISLSAQELEQHVVTNVFTGPTFSKHISFINVGLYEATADNQARQLVQGIAIPYAPAMGTVEKVSSNALQTLAQQLVFGEKDRGVKFSFALQLMAVYGNKPNSFGLIASSGGLPEANVFTLDANLTIPPEALSLPILYASYMGYWEPDIIGVNFIPVDEHGVEGKKIQTPNGVDDPTCPLIAQAGNGFVFINNIYVRPVTNAPHFHIEFVSANETVVMDNQTGEVIKPVISVRPFEQEVLTNVFVGTNFARHISDVAVGLYRVNDAYPDGRLVKNVQLPYSLSLGSVEQVLDAALQRLKLEFKGTTADVTNRFYLYFVAATTYGTQTTVTPLVANSLPSAPFGLNDVLSIPVEVQVPIELSYASYMSYWMPDVTAVNFIPIDASGLLGKKVSTPNGVDDPTCPLIKLVGNGFVFLNNIYVRPVDGPHFQIEFVFGAESVFMDNKTGEILTSDAIGSQSIGLASVKKGAVNVEVRGTGKVTIQSSNDLFDWQDSFTITAPGAFIDTNGVRAVRFYRIKPVQSPPPDS